MKKCQKLGAKTAPWPAPPSALRAAAKTHWEAIAPQLGELGLVRASDRHVLARYCETLAHYYEANAQLHADGIVYESRGKHGAMKRLHPLVGVTSRLAARLQNLEDKLGMNPAARSALIVRALPTMAASPADAPEADDVLGFFSKTTH